MVADGSPGANRMTTNAMMVTSHITNASETTRDTKNRTTLPGRVTGWLSTRGCLLAPDVPQARGRIERREAFERVAVRVEAEQIADLDHRDIVVDDILDLLVNLGPRFAVRLNEGLVEESIDDLARVRLIA